MTVSDTNPEDASLIFDHGMTPMRITTLAGIQHVVDPISRLVDRDNKGYFLAFLVNDPRRGIWGDLVRCRLATPGSPGIVELIVDTDVSRFVLEDNLTFSLRVLRHYARDFVLAGTEAYMRKAVRRVIRNCAPLGLLNWVELMEEISLTSIGNRSLIGSMTWDNRDAADEITDTRVAPNLNQAGVPIDSRYVDVLVEAVEIYDLLDIQAAAHVAAIDEEIAAGSQFGGEGNEHIDHSI